MIPPLFFGLIVIIGSGWILEKRTPLAVPLVVMSIGGFLLGQSWGMVGTLLVDLYPDSPSTATAAFNLMRCSMTAGASAVVQYMIDAMGVGWCYTLVGLLCFAASPLLWVVLRWGPQWREERFVRVEKKREAQEQRIRDLGHERRPEADT